MLVTLSGITIFVNDVHPLNAFSPILFTVLGMLYSVVSFLFCGYFIIVNLYLSNNIPSLLLYFILFLSTSILSKLSQLSNTSLPILVTLAGIVTFVSAVHP